MKCPEKQREAEAARLFLLFCLVYFFVFSRSIFVLCSSLCHEWTGCVGDSMGRLLCLSLSQRRRKKTTTSYSWFWKSKIDKLSLKVIQSVRKLYYGPLDVFLKSGGGANLSIGVIGVTSCCLLSSLEKVKRTHRTISSFQTHWRCRMRGFWLIFSPDRLTSRCTSVPQYYHPILSAPVVSHGTAVSNPAVAKSSSRPEEAACMRAYVWVGA